MMDQATVDDVIAYAGRCGFDVIDITGGAPELNPNIERLIEGVSSLAPRLMFRSNLSALHDGGRDNLMKLLRDKRYVIVASFPSVNEAQAEGQRGSGIFKKSIAVLQGLNALGYGHEGSGLELDLVANPTGAFLPSSQKELERRFKEVLLSRWGIVFNRLFSFANVPLGRFREWLEERGLLKTYIDRLTAGFNPCAVEGLMCRSLVSVSWDGCLYDCDFNLARGLYYGGKRIHVSSCSGPPPEGASIATADHCFTCTAGQGFT
jgi:radical SAM/Cys-rich protein